uniref:Uncharacterized protein n=1 Tax=viral metagenome TaxID=1070528 RepID=A0A6C0LNI0_9ZZZZ
MSVPDSRNSELRRSETIEPTQMQFPFMFCQPQFGYANKNIYVPLPNQSFITVGEYPTGFPANIQDFLWIEQGNPGTDTWKCLGRLNFGAFFYYTAYCNDTAKTFLDGGSMTLSVSWEYGKLIHYAMSSVDYAEYISETVPCTLSPIHYDPSSLISIPAIASGEPNPNPGPLPPLPPLPALQQQ